MIKIYKYNKLLQDEVESFIKSNIKTVCSQLRRSFKMQKVQTGCSVISKTGVSIIFIEKRISFPAN